MKVIVQKLFEKDIHKIGDKKLARQISVAIEEMEKAAKLSDLRNIKRWLTKAIIIV